MFLLYVLLSIVMLFGCASEGADYLDEKEPEDNLIEDRADESTDVNPNEEQQIPVNSEVRQRILKHSMRKSYQLWTEILLK